MAKKLMTKRVVYEITLQGKEQKNTYTAFKCSKTIYSDVNEGTEVENLSFADCCDRFHYGKFSSKILSKLRGACVGDKFCEMWVDTKQGKQVNYSIIIHNKNFISFKILTTYKKLNYEVSLENLMKKLSANEMIEYLKDNGLNACPMIE